MVPQSWRIPMMQRKSSNQRVAITSTAIFQVALGAVTVYFIYVLAWVIQVHNDTSVVWNEDAVEPDDFGQPWDEGRRDVRRRALKEVYKIPRSSDEAYNLNESLGQTISLDRRSPDLRPEECKHISYIADSLPNVSVVIAFHNEAVSFLLRTVHSVLNYTPAQLLAEILLVDDRSSNANLLEPLDSYVSLMPSKVRLIRLPNREGLIRARMIGYRQATGQVMVFVDAHVEVSSQWIEPMLRHIQMNPYTIVQPTINAIDATTVSWPAYDSVDHSNLYRGIFLWDMRFAWQQIPKQYLQWRPSAAEPFPNPILIGSAMAVDREYFRRIGGFDEGLNIWGGDNIDLSLRTWLCGGRLVVHPCSRVGHVFKPFSFSFGGDKEIIVAKNNMRVVETWMPHHRDYYYASSFVYKYKRAEMSPSEKASLATYRLSVDRQKCREFSWFLENILPELPLPGRETDFFGEIQNLYSRYCFFVHADGYIGLTANCLAYSINRQNAEFGLTSSGQMTYQSQCVFVADSLLLMLGSCTLLSHQPRIEFEKNTDIGESAGRLTYSRRGRKYCLQHVTNVVDVHRQEQMPQFFPECYEGNSWQQWVITYHFGWSHVPAPFEDPLKQSPNNASETLFQ